MDTTTDGSGLYIPYCVQRDGPAQPIGTAFTLDMGKHSCLQHFLQRCRTARQRLTPEQRAETPGVSLDTLRLEWSQLPSGVYEGETKGLTDTALPGITEVSYKLAPA